MPHAYEQAGKPRALAGAVPRLPSEPKSDPLHVPEPKEGIAPETAAVESEVPEPTSVKQVPGVHQPTGPCWCRHGFYQALSRYAYPIRCRDLWEDQVNRGLRTATVYQHCMNFYDPNDRVHGFAMYVEDLLEVGLISVDFPVLVLSLGGKYAAKAQTYATRPWPELVIANVDDPSAHDLDLIREVAEEAHEYGFRNGTHITGYNLEEEIASYIDVWMVTAYTWHNLRTRTVDKRGKEIWSCYHWDLSHDPLLARLLFGVWCWANDVPCLLVWAYLASSQRQERLDGTVLEGLAQGDSWPYSYVTPRPKGPPIPTSGYLGAEQGIRDCRALEWAQEHDDASTRQLRKDIRQLWSGNWFPQPPMHTSELTGQPWKDVFPVLETLHARAMDAPTPEKPKRKQAR